MESFIDKIEHFTLSLFHSSLDFWSFFSTNSCLLRSFSQWSTYFLRKKLLPLKTNGFITASPIVNNTDAVFCQSQVTFVATSCATKASWSITVVTNYLQFVSFYVYHIWFYMVTVLTQVLYICYILPIIPMLSQRL